MSVKYHISPSTGRPNLCRADLRSCPVGGEHFATKEEARAGFEATMAGATVAKPAKKTRFAPDQLVESVTAWSYSDLAPGPRALGRLQKAYPDLTFRSSANDEMIVTGPAASVEAYLNEPGGEARDVRKSLAAMVAVETAPSAPTFTEEGEALPDENLFDDWEAAGGWEDEIFSLEADDDLAKPPTSEDDDYDSIKCDGCDQPLSMCRCGECDLCGGLEDDHEEDCPRRPVKGYRYSWE